MKICMMHFCPPASKWARWIPHSWYIHWLFDCYAWKLSICDNAHRSSDASTGVYEHNEHMWTILRIPNRKYCSSGSMLLIGFGLSKLHIYWNVHNSIGHPNYFEWPEIDRNSQIIPRILRLATIPNVKHLPTEAKVNLLFCVMALNEIFP